MQIISDSEYYKLASSPQDYRSADGKINTLDDIITDYSLLAKSSDPKVFDGCVVQFLQVDASQVQNGSQMIFTPSGGMFDKGYLQTRRPINDNQDTKFVLEWYPGEETGYYMWPNNNSKKQKMVILGTQYAG